MGQDPPPKPTVARPGHPGRDHFRVIDPTAGPTGPGDRHGDHDRATGLRQHPGRNELDSQSIAKPGAELRIPAPPLDRSDPVRQRRFVGPEYDDAVAKGSAPRATGAAGRAGRVQPTTSPAPGAWNGRPEAGRIPLDRTNSAAVGPEPCIGMPTTLIRRPPHRHGQPEAGQDQGPGDHA